MNCTFSTFFSLTRYAIKTDFKPNQLNVLNYYIYMTHQKILTTYRAKHIPINYSLLMNIRSNTELYV